MGWLGVELPWHELRHGVGSRFASYFGVVLVDKVLYFKELSISLYKVLSGLGVDLS